MIIVVSFAIDLVTFSHHVAVTQIKCVIELKAREQL